MCTSLVIWYIVDGRTGGVITMLWFFIFVELYFLLRYPRFIVIVLLSMITQILIIGYELEVRKIGVQASQSAEQSSAIPDANLIRLRQEPDNLRIQSISLHHIDWHV